MAARKRSAAKSGRKARPKARKPAAKARPTKVKAKTAPKAKVMAKPKVMAKVVPKAKVAPKPKIAAKRPAPARPRAARATPVDRAGMHGEYDALKARAAVITNMLRGASDDQARALEIGPWAQLLADLDAWAAKYSVPVNERTVSHDPSPSPTDPTPRWRTPGRCRAEIHERHPGGGYVDCFFRRQTLIGDQCIYRCYTIGFPAT